MEAWVLLSRFQIPSMIFYSNYKSIFKYDPPKSSLRNPLPPLLAKPPEILPSDHFKTTTGTFHDDKYPFGPLQQAPLFKKSPGHHNVHYLKDFMENIPNRGWRRPLSPSNQKSETHDEFCNKAPLSEPNKWMSVQNFDLYNHHTDGPSKVDILSLIRSLIVVTLT